MNAFNPFELLALGLLLIIRVTLSRIERRLRENDHKLDLLVRNAGIDPLKPAEPSERVRLLAQQPSQQQPDRLLHADTDSMIEHELGELRPIYEHDGRLQRLGV